MLLGGVIAHRQKKLVGSYIFVAVSEPHRLAHMLGVGLGFYLVLHLVICQCTLLMSSAFVLDRAAHVESL